VAGRAAPQEEALDALMEGDFDPEEYDKRMAAAFGDDYYAAVRAAGGEHVHRLQGGRTGGGVDEGSTRGGEVLASGNR
jgi:hypothetical protein